MFGAHGSEQTHLTRPVAGVQIPDGTRVTLDEGVPVRIAQALGDTYTLVTPWGVMVRIEAADADAIGKEPAAGPGHGGEPDRPLEEQVWEQLRTCYDPEIPIDIVELGLIYDCTLVPDEGGRRAAIKMTLTAPGCGMGQVLADDVRRKVEALPGISGVDVELVFDPPWNPNMMSEAARLQLGMF